MKLHLLRPYLSLVWAEIISELLVNLGSAWFALAVVEPKVNPPFSRVAPLLTSRVVFGMLSLVLAKQFREAAKENDRS